MLIERCAPAEIYGIDPSEAQLAFARSRPGARMAEFRQGHAMELPFADSRFDAAVMALVIFYVPDAAKGAAEMARVVAPGGTVAAYVWDTANDRSPMAPIRAQQREMGFVPVYAPNVAASRMEALRDLWAGAGLDRVEAREIKVKRTVADFEDFWATTLTMPNIGPPIAMLAPADAERLKAAVQHRLPADNAGRITYSARANAIVGRVPG